MTRDTRDAIRFVWDQVRWYDLFAAGWASGAIWRWAPHGVALLCTVALLVLLVSATAQRVNAAAERTMRDIDRRSMALGAEDDQ